MIILIGFISSFTLTLLFTPYLILYLKKNKIVDNPDERRIHQNAIPRMGGLVIYIVALITLLLCSDDLYQIKILFITSFFIFVCGFVDDIMGLKWNAKFILQFISAALLVFYLQSEYSTFKFFFLEIPFEYSIPLLIFFTIGAFNSVNLLDGLDGLASGFALIVFVLILGLAYLLNIPFLMIFSGIMIGSLIGFLRFNAYPAKIFLGDLGSLTLGFSLVLSTLLLSINSGVLDLTFSFIVLALPIIDTIRVMLHRIWNNRNPFHPDLNHIHHRLMNIDIPHKIVVVILHVVSSLYILTGFGSTLRPKANISP